MNDIRPIDRALAWAQEKGWNQSTFASRLGVAPANVTNWKSRGLPPEHYKLVADALGRSVDELLGAAVTASAVANNRIEPAAIPGNGQPETLRPYPSGKRIPVVGSAQLGDNGHFVELEYPVGYGDGWVDVLSTDPNAYALRCRGDSMRPRIRDGEYIVAEPNREVAPGDQVVVKARDGRVMVKTYLYRRDGRIHLQSVNESHPSIVLLPDEVEAMHCVTNITTRYVTE